MDALSNDAKQHRKGQMEQQKEFSIASIGQSFGMEKLSIAMELNEDQMVQQKILLRPTWGYRDIFYGIRPSVQLSYCIKDTYFANRLCIGLEDAGYDPLGSSLTHRCKLAVVVLSPHFLTSFSCMRELHTFLISEGYSSKILPLFYKLHPNDLKDTSPIFDELQAAWRNTLAAPFTSFNQLVSAVNSIQGIAHHDTHTMADEDDYIKEVLLRVSHIVRRYDISNLIGHERLTNEVDNQLFQMMPAIEHRKAARVIGFYGIGGLGKTTLCKLMVNNYERTYAGRCALIEFPTNDCNEKAVVAQCGKALDHLNSYTIRLGDFKQCLELMKEQLSSLDVFIALDNISEASLDFACKILDVGFSANSIILATSRRRQVLVSLLKGIWAASHVMPVPSINSKEAHQIFVKGFDLSQGSGHLKLEDVQVDDVTQSCRFEGAYNPLGIRALGLGIGRSGGDHQSRFAAWEQESRNATDTDALLYKAIKTNFDSIPPERRLIFLHVVSMCIPDAENFMLPRSELHAWLSAHYERMDSWEIAQTIRELEYDGLLEFYNEREVVHVHDLYRELATQELKRSQVGDKVLLHEDKTKEGEKLHPSFEDLKQPTKSDDQSSVSQKSELPAMTPASPPSLASPIEPIIDKGQIKKLLLTLENNTCPFISVGVIHAIPSENLEFYFFNAKHMAICVGVGLPRAKVTLHNDLSITIEETTVSEKELTDSWMPLLRDTSCHLVMKVQEPGTQFNGEQLENVDTLLQYGVGFEDDSLYIVDETCDAAEVSWPLLYDLALFILTSDDVQCPNETNSTSSSAEGSGSFQGRSNQDNNMVHKLQGKHKSVSNSGDFQGSGGDGDGDGDGSEGEDVLEDDPPVVSKVTVYPLEKSDIVDIQGMPDGLDGASIAPTLVFEFRKTKAIKRISIKTQTQLELGSKRDVILSKDHFGWYHTNIQISFGCENREGHEQSGRVGSRLKPGSCKISNMKTSHTYTAAKSETSTKASTHTYGGQAGFNVLSSVQFQGSSSDSTKKEEATSAGGNIEMTSESICGGFSFKNSSRGASPAFAKFRLFYPREKWSIWGDKDFLQGQGLFSSIEPSIAATFIPLDADPLSPYFFEVERFLGLHKRVDAADQLKESVLDPTHTQMYKLFFYVNQAMTHLRRDPIELHGNQQRVDNVIEIGSVLTVRG